MQLSIQILLLIVSFIFFLGGTNLLINKSKPFLPENKGYYPSDNVIRFLSSIYFSLGFLLLLILYRIEEYHTIIYFLGYIVMFSGAGRLSCYLKINNIGTGFKNIIWIEVFLGIVIIILQILREIG